MAELNDRRKLILLESIYLIENVSNTEPHRIADLNACLKNKNNNHENPS